MHLGEKSLTAVVDVGQFSLVEIDVQVTGEGLEGLEYELPSRGKSHTRKEVSQVKLWKFELTSIYGKLVNKLALVDSLLKVCERKLMVVVSVLEVVKEIRLERIVDEKIIQRKNFVVVVPILVVRRHIQRREYSKILNQHETGGDVEGEHIILVGVQFNLVLENGLVGAHTQVLLEDGGLAKQPIHSHFYFY